MYNTVQRRNDIRTMLTPYVTTVPRMKHRVVAWVIDMLISAVESPIRKSSVVLYYLT